VTKWKSDDYMYLAIITQKNTHQNLYIITMSQKTELLKQIFTTKIVNNLDC